MIPAQSASAPMLGNSYTCTLVPELPQSKKTPYPDAALAADTNRHVQSKQRERMKTIKTYTSKFKFKFRFARQTLI